jgi:hypothetical protein
MQMVRASLRFETTLHQPGMYLFDQTRERHGCVRSRGPYYSLARPVFETVEGHGESLSVDASSDSLNASACSSINRPEKCQCGVQIFRARAAP